MDILNTLLSAGVSLLSIFVGYLLGRRSKIDEIQLAKKHELAEQLSVLLQEDFDDRLNLRQEYHENFDHLKDLSEAMYYFDKHQNLYSGIRKRMERMPTRRDSLKVANRKAAIYLPENVTSSIDEYLKLTYFTYWSDGVGFINSFAEEFFKNLLDDDTWESLQNHYTSILNRLRKSLK